MKAGDKLRTISDEDYRNVYYPLAHEKRNANNNKYVVVQVIKEKDIIRSKILAKTINGCKETFSYSDVIAPSGKLLQVKDQGKWRNVTKGDLS